MPGSLLGVRGCSLLNPPLLGVCQVTRWSLSCAAIPLAEGRLCKIFFPFIFIQSKDTLFTELQDKVKCV